MKYNSLLLTIALAGLSINVSAEKDFKIVGEKILANGLSPNGKYLVGVSNEGKFRVDGFMAKSFIYDTENGTLSWITELDTNDFSKAGEFKTVSDNGIICGTTKDINTKINNIYNDKGSGFACSAAIWTDGKCILLEMGDFDLQKIHYSGDGSSSEDISADGKVVVGNFITDNNAYVTPCKWTKNENGEYELEWLTLPTGIKSGNAKKVSEDGATVFGTVTQEDKNTYIAIWYNNELTTITENNIGVTNNNGYNMSLVDVSPNGKFILLYEQMNGFFIYNMENEESRPLPAFDDYGIISNASIDNNGNVVSSYNYGNPILGPEPYTHPFWYSYEYNTLLDFTYYMSIFAEGVTSDIEFSFENKTRAMPCLTSGDGTITAGNTDIYEMLAQTSKCYILKVENENVEIPAVPSGLKAKSDAIGEVNIYWTKDRTEYNTLTLQSYNIYRDNAKVGELDASAQEMSFHETGVAGHPNYSIEAVYAKTEGGTMPSPKSIPLKASVPDTYALPFFENFDDESGYDKNFWTFSIDYGDKYDTQWNMEVGYGLYMTNSSSIYFSSLKPYSTSLVSRPMDATKEKSVELSFINIYGFIGYEGQNLDKDSMSVEISIDKGNTWKTIKDWSINELNPQHKWNMINLDISNEVAGKIFQIRFHSHGQGVASYYLQIENVKISTGSENKAEAPQGLTGLQSEKEQPLSLIWKNKDGAYQLNHIRSFVEGMLTLGNEGKEMIGANSFEPEDLAIYKGKYLTGVKTIINFYDWYEVVLGINASVVVFEDGKLIREQEIEDMVYNEYFTVKLDEPLLIDGNKELKIGIKIHDYDAGQIPLMYTVSDKFIAGKSDLYSEDNGATWNKVSDFYEANDERGYCCWNITGCITDTPELNLAEDNNELYSYNVFCNGELITTAALDKLQTNFNIDNPTDGDSFHVVAYYIDGTVSTPSDVFIYDTNGVEQNITDNSEVYFNHETNEIIVNGKFDYMDIINLNGTRILRTTEHYTSLPNIQSGIYILRIQKDNNVIVKKILVK